MNTLDLLVVRPLKPHTEAEWSSWTSEAKVISTMLTNSGLQENSVAAEIGIDPATLSKVTKGLARLPEKSMNALMSCSGDEAWLHYWMLKRGYDPRCLRQLESDLERENRELKEKLIKIEAEREVELRLFSRLRPA